MGENGLTASDVALLNDRNGMDFSGNSFMWIFALLILAGGGFNGFNNGYHPQYATQDFVQNGFNFNDLQDQNRDIMNAITNGTAQSVAATNQVFHDTINALSDKYSELARDIAGVQMSVQQGIANQNNCCCETKQLIQGVGANINAGIAQNRYEAALNTAAINANMTAQTQKILDVLSQNTIDALQNRVNQLELQNATANVVRYPNAWTYNAGMSPFCNCNCGAM